MKGFSKSHIEGGVIRNHAEPFSSHNYAYGRHASRDGKNRTTKYHKNVFILCTQRKIEHGKIASGIGFAELKETMVREKIKREPLGGVKELEGEEEGVAQT